jgi:Zn-dependent protease
LSYNPFYEAPLHNAGRPRVSFSRTEVLHLLAAVVTLAVSFVLLQAHGNFVRAFAHPDLIALLTSVLGVSLGFILHELAHKVVAQRYGHWAEFRASATLLGFTLLMALFAPFLVAAPGAVMIQGQVTRRENGIISLVGPGTNILIVALTYPLAWSTNVEAAMPRVFGGIAAISSILAVFNLVPLGPLDGRKVWAWSKLAYLATLALAVVLAAYVLFISPNAAPF